LNLAGDQQNCFKEGLVFTLLWLITGSAIISTLIRL